MLQFINPKTFSLAKKQFTADEFVIFTHPNMSELNSQSDRDVNTFNKYKAGRNISLLGEYIEDGNLVSAYGINAARVFANGETEAM